MKAIRIKAAGTAEVQTGVPVPKLRDDYILIKTEAVALNPTDWKHIDFLAGPGARVGCDYSGIVEEVGSKVQNGIKVGDRVAGMIHGSNPSNHEDGSFAEYVVAKGALQMRIPDTLSFEDAATLGAGIITMGQSLYQSLGLPLPNNPSKENIPVLIYGGSTATGTLAIQFAKLSGLQVIVTCSPRNEKLVRDLGADFVFDYKSPTCAADIRSATNNRLAHAFDTIASNDSAQICCSAIGPQGGRYTSLEPIEKLPRDDVTKLNTMAFTAVGEAFEIAGFQVPAKEEDYTFAVIFTRLAQDLLAQQKFKPHPVSVQEGGLDSVLDGLQRMREGRVSGVKLVYPI
ncbi:zinc-binding oxidoreductase protein [Pochonia chlamydosporia 170]|uniref:Zinc-binding oxidoreductase protein n=1 Tax=Pochonia chlamydosporia 170 TaxID=1380566 RepID=A0A179FBI6_METCM|nr:zinc-binding oxidoreductase protein [Pochonia chlamydosporia 170]OAQ62670.1 zinc-binding oxidoreductase protein [Pochonia chlamydosporia 170]